MRLALALALACLGAAGCRSDVREARLDLTQVSRLLRAYGAASKPAGVRAIPRLSPEQLNDLGVMLERRGMLDRAEEHYRRAVEVKPEFGRAWVNLGNVLRRQGRTDEALDCYRRALVQDPPLFEAVNNFADLCADSGQCVPEALGLLEPALDRHPPEESIGRDTLGKVLTRAGRTAEAARAFRAASDMCDPRDRALRAEMLGRLAQAYRALGDRERARSAELRAAALSAEPAGW